MLYILDHWDEREKDWKEQENPMNPNFHRHSMECPNCRSNTWSFLCFIPDFKTGRMSEGCNECDKRASTIWARENIKSSTLVTGIVLGGIGLIGFSVGYVLGLL